ncbi:MAG: DEAD/DEAH box helicase [Rhodobacteraceae bacterium]|nr:DEAD/DEAH box helicase [Paracoccaceae bacterium]
MTIFNDLGLAPTLLTALESANLTKPTPIQAKAIPLAIEGRDVLGLAQTGTGKTLAFGLPLVDALIEQQGKPHPRCVKALILAPTRELVNQIGENLRPLVKGTKLRVSTVIGGQSINKQIAFLTRGTDILVATPGRLIDLMDREAIDLSRTFQLVLDEADQMLDMGFIHALRKIAPALGTPRQTMLFSATMSKEMEDLSGRYLTDPVKVQVSPPGKAADKITQSLYFVEKAGKPGKLRDVLTKELTLVFCRTKHGAERLMKGLVADGYKAASIHGNKSQGQRDRALKAFKEGEINILVCTDVAARGIDIPGVAYVINFDLPEVPENYVHRIGRTARAGREGEAIAFCAADEIGYLKAIEKVMKLEIAVAEGERPEAAQPPHKKRQGGGGGGGGRRKGPGRNMGAPKQKGPRPAKGNAGPDGGNRRRRGQRRRKAA